MHKALNLARRHWFYHVLPLLLTTALTFRASYPWQLDPKLGEATTIFDWCVFVPLIYAVCYRNMPRRALVLRTLAMVCGGIWIAAKLVPDQTETILHELGWARGLGIAVLAIFEGMAFVAAMRILFGGEPDTVALEHEGMPPLLVKLILAEARFWRWIWSKLRSMK